jgi:predicted  nucleic acid-binding Zn-ribbon protein
MDINPGGIRLTESKFNVTDLVELQLIENAISARSTEIENIKNNKEQVSALKELEQVAKKFDEVNGAYSDLESKRKKLEDTVELQNEKIKNDESKLFSGTIMSAKELENYQEEVKILKQKNSEMEDKILELMIELEEMSDKVKQAAAEKDKAEANVNRINNEMNEKIEVLKHIVEGLRKRKDDVISRIPKDHLKKYNEVKTKKGGIAVSVLKNNFCNVCNMEIPTIAAEKIEDIDEVYSCPLCGRMSVIYRSEIDTIKKELES